MQPGYYKLVNGTYKVFLWVENNRAHVAICDMINLRYFMKCPLPYLINNLFTNVFRYIQIKKVFYEVGQTVYRSIDSFKMITVEEYKNETSLPFKGIYA